MKNGIKRFFAVLMAVAILIGIAPLTGLTGFIKASANYTYIQYGNYPQSRETNSSIISALNSKAGSTDGWTSYGYYSGTGSWSYGQMTAKDYMRYTDVMYGGAKYRGVYFSSYRPRYTGSPSSYSNSNQDDNGYSTGTKYWFKYEPLTWRVLDSAEGLVLCESIIDSQAYNNYNVYFENENEHYGNDSKEYYSNNYYYSSIRKWLNDDFYNIAFNKAQKNNIETTELDNRCSASDSPQYNAPSSNDNIFMLSYNDAFNSNYGFTSSHIISDTVRRAQGTDYAKCQGLSIDIYSDYGGSDWWLRSPSYYSCDACDVDSRGGVGVQEVVYTGIGVRPACRLSNLKSDISQSGISSSNSGLSVSASIDSIRIVPRKADASVKLNAANFASHDIKFSLDSVTAQVGGKTFTQNTKHEINIPSKDVTGDITIKRSGYNDYVIPLGVYNSFTTASLDNILDYDAYMTKSDGTNRPYISSVFGRVSGSGDSFIDLTNHSLKVKQDESYDFYLTALNTSTSPSYSITQDDGHKINPSSSGYFTSSTIGTDLTNGKTAYAYVTSGGKRSNLVSLKLDVEKGEENWFVKQLKQGTFSIGGSSGLSIKVPESWRLIGGSELNIADFNFPIGMDITGNKVKVSVGFDLWNKTTIENSTQVAIDPETQQQIDKMTYITEKKSGVITDGMWKTVKDGLKDAEWGWKNASTNSKKNAVKKRLADHYGLNIGELSSSNKKTSGFDVSALGYMEGEIVGGKFILTDFMISCSGSFTISYTHQMAVGYIGIEGGGTLTISFSASRAAADQFVSFDLETGIQVTPQITPRAGLGFDGVASIGVYGTASMPMGLTFSFTNKALTASIQINGEIGYEAQLLFLKTGRRPLVSGTLGPWTHTWNFSKKSAKSYMNFINPDLLEGTLLPEEEKITLTPMERCSPSSWLGETKNPFKKKAKGISTQAGVTISNLQTDVFAQSEAKIITCGDTTLAAWTAEDPHRDTYNRLRLVYSVYDADNNTWSEPKAVYDDGYVDSTPYLATDGNDIYIAWQKYVKTFDETNSTQVQDILCSSEIFTAKYDAQNDEFIQPTRLTNNNSYDYTPVAAVNNGTATVYYATNPANTLISAEGNKISKYVSGTTSTVKTNLSTVTAMDSAVVNSTVQLAYSTDTDGDIETTNDINVFSGSSTFTAAPATDENAQNSIKGFTFAKIGAQTKLLYTDGVNIYYESDGESVPILENGANISGRIYAVENGNATDIFWLSKTEYGNELYSATYKAGEWSEAVAVTDRGNEFSNLALTCVNNTLLGVANETFVTAGEEEGTYTKGETNLVFIKVNDFVDLTADSIDILEYDKAVGDLTGISVTVTNNGNVKQNRLNFSISDSNGAETEYYIDTELLPGRSDIYWLPYEIPSDFAGTSVTVTVTGNSGTDINDEDNAVTYSANKSDILASALPVTYLKDGCILSAEIVNYNFADAENVQAVVAFEDGGETVSENYIGTIDKNSKATVEFSYAFDELTFDEDGIAKVYMTVTADNAESTTLTFLVEQSSSQCAHPFTEDLGQIEPTCTENGYHAGSKCLGCGEYVSGGEEIPATGHTPETDAGLEPTCTETGLTEGTHCSVCGAVLTEQEEIEPLGHDFSTSSITTAPDCTHTGIRTYYCSRCDATRTETVSANGHTWDSGTVTKEPTCFETGIRKYTCTVCGAEKEENISKLSHNYVNGVCTRCGTEIPSIRAGETKTVSITGGSLSYLKFVPSVTGNYTFTSNSSSDTYGYLYDADFNQITSNDDGGNGSNFKITYDFTKGQTYYFGCRYYNSSTSGSYDVELIMNSYSPEVEDITLHEQKDVTVSGDEVLRYRFIPVQSGTYYFYNFSSDEDLVYNTGAILYNESMEQLSTDDISGYNYMFKIAYDFTAGETYYFDVATMGITDETEMHIVLTDEFKVIMPYPGSSTVVDYETGYIYGIEPGSSIFESVLFADIESLVEAPDDEVAAASIPTGYSLIHYTDNDEIDKRYTFIIFGDVNGDGWYDGQDSFIVNCIANGMLDREQVGEAKWLAADCNHDGEINSSDVLLLEQAGLLLANVDQTMSQEELMESDSYMEYLNLIDQNPAGEEPIPEEPAEPDPTPQTFLAKFIEILQKVITFIRSLFPKI